MIEAAPEPDTLVLRASAAFEQFRAGDRAAFDTLVEMLTPLLWHTVRTQRLDATSTEDVLQTVWLGLVRSAPAVRDPRTIVKWLIVSARREAWRVSRRASVERTHTRLTRVEDVEEEVARVPVPADQLPEALTLRNHRDRRLWSHVRALPARCQELLRVIAFSDRPDYASLAESLDMPVGSIGPTRGRCLARLRAMLADDPEWTP